MHRDGSSERKPTADSDEVPAAAEVDVEWHVLCPTLFLVIIPGSLRPVVPTSVEPRSSRTAQLLIPGPDKLS